LRLARDAPQWLDGLTLDVDALWRELDRLMAEGGEGNEEDA
jgi:hypothetical protein